MDDARDRGETPHRAGAARYTVRRNPYDRRRLDPMPTAAEHSSAPSRSLTQRLDALERANVVRTRRAQLKRDIKAGRESMHALLTVTPEYVETAKVFDMLLAVPKYGRVKVNKVLTQCRISPSKTMGGLSDRQREELGKLLRRG
jgi:hypothetical protein